MASARHVRNAAVRSGETAIIIIDVQQYWSVPGQGVYTGFTAESIPQEHKYFFDRMDNVTVPAIQELLNAFRVQRKESRADIIYTYVECLTKDGRDQSLDYKLSNFYVPKGHPHAKMLDAVAPQDDEILIPKTSCSVFNSTNIEYVLRNLGVSQVVITGIVTNQCVESAVRDAADRGFYVIVPEEAVATHTDEDHRQSLKNMKGFARICSYKDIVEEMAMW